MLPLVGRVAAGSPILAQEHVDQTYYVEDSLFQHKPDYLLKVRGMSMRDIGIMDGDLLAVKIAHEARNGQIIVARLGDDVTVKRLRRTAHAIELPARKPRLPGHRRRARRALCHRRTGRRPDPQHHAHVEQYMHRHRWRALGRCLGLPALRRCIFRNPACVQPLPSGVFTWELPCWLRPPSPTP